jgi:hypothetical protein
MKEAMEGAKEATPKPARAYTAIISPGVLVKKRRKEVEALSARPKIISLFLPSLSDRDPRGIARMAAITMNREDINPTSTVLAPTDLAKRGSIGIRMNTPI